MPDKKLFLLDGHALVYRAHFAFIARPLINSKGVNTSAVAGFTRTLVDLMKNENPTHIAVAFDPPEPTFRHEMYEPYKANREEQPEDIAIAFPFIRRIVEGFHIPILTVPGFEADDVIGTLAKQAEQEGYTVYMVTPDKDFSQLVSENIFLYKPSRQGNGVEILGIPEILKKWDVQKVEQVIDVLGLQGDSVDNIPGIPGIGPKTASKLLAKYGSIENLLEHTGDLKGKQKERVIEFGEQGLLSKKLATIDTEVPIRFEAEKFIIDPPDRESLAEVFKELEFRTLAKSVLDTPEAAKTPTQGSLFSDEEGKAPGPAAPPAHSVADNNFQNTEQDYRLADSPEKRKKLIDTLSGTRMFCFDTETTGIDPNEAELVGMSFAIRPGQAWYVPVPEDQEEAHQLVHEFKELFEDPAIAKIAQNLKYDAIMLKWYGIELKGEYYDTMIEHYLLEPELRHNMDYLAETYLKYKPISIETLIGKKGKNQLSMRDVAVEKVVNYAAEDADITLRLKEYLTPKLEEEGLTELYRKIEAPLIDVLVGMEYEGIKVDREFLEQYAVELEGHIAEVEAKIYELAGQRFNIGSPKQVGEILFEHLKIPYRWRKTKSGQYSTSEEKLAEMASDHPVIDDILKYRGLTKLKSTYVDALPRLINPRTQRIHSSFNQTIAATGRLSSNNPNLQNIPIRTPEGAKVREAFVPRDKDHLLLAADYSQIELRLIAEISGDEAMLEAFQKGQDIHRATAARVFDTAYEEVSREQRSRAKTVNFAIIYGAGATNLAQQLDIKRSEAAELIDQYFRKYSGIKSYMDNTVGEARQKGYVKTLMGRRRTLRDINARSSLQRSMAERMAINTPIQGTAADMIKIAMINIHQAIREKGLRSRMVLQVHDELVFDALRSELDELKPLIEDLMRNAIPKLKVPIVVEIGTGENWLEAH